MPCIITSNPWERSLWRESWCTPPTSRCFSLWIFGPLARLGVLSVLLLRALQKNAAWYGLLELVVLKREERGITEQASVLASIIPSPRTSSVFGGTKHSHVTTIIRVSEETPLVFV